MLLGRWTCRQCDHRRKHSNRNCAEIHEALQKAIINDENGRVDSLDNRCPLKSTIDCGLGCDSDDDAEAAECGDQVAPLEKLSMANHASAQANDCMRAGHLVLMLDMSGSMRTEDVQAEAPAEDRSIEYVCRLEAAVFCAARFVSAHALNRALDVFSLVTFDEDADVIVALVDSARMLQALGALPLRGAQGTFYGPALKAGVSLLRRKLGVLSHVVFLSDGRPADTKGALEIFQREYMQGALAGTRVHGIGFGSVVQSFAPLQQLACLSGGSFTLSGCSISGLWTAFSSVTSTITILSAELECDRNECHGTQRNLRTAVFELPELGAFGKRGTLCFYASRTEFKFDGEDFTANHWQPSAVIRRTNPYMRGGMRLVYGFQDKTVVPDEGSWMVAKASRFVDEALNTRETVESHAKSTAVARHFAARFNERVHAAKEPTKVASIYFVPCFVYEVSSNGQTLSGDEVRLFAAERYLPGAFLKYNSNNGYVCEGSVRHHDAVQALLHFSFVASNGRMIVADLQGVARDAEVLLTDPQVLSTAQIFGPGDLGARGMRACLTAHRCGSACQALGLKPLSVASLRGLGVPGTRSTVRGGNSRQSKDATSSSGISDGWERVSDSHVGSDWDKLSERNPVEYSMSDGIQSSQASASSWVHILDH